LVQEAEVVKADAGAPPATMQQWCRSLASSDWRLKAQGRSVRSTVVVPTPTSTQQTGQAVSSVGFQRVVLTVEAA